MRTSSHECHKNLRLVTWKFENFVSKLNMNYLKNFVSWILWELRLPNVVRTSPRDKVLWELRLKTEKGLSWKLRLMNVMRTTSHDWNRKKRVYHENFASWMLWELRLMIEIGNISRTSSLDRIRNVVRISSRGRIRNVMRTASRDIMRNIVRTTSQVWIGNIMRISSHNRIGMS